MKKSIIVSLVFGLFFVIVNNTYADLILSDVGGTWSNVIGGSNINYIDNVFIGGYGTGYEDRVLWCDGPSGQSGLGFTPRNNPSNPISITIGEAFDVGQLRHFNNPINSPPPTSVDLEIDLLFSNPSGLTGEFFYTLSINETPNVTGGSPGDDDIITFPVFYPSQTFEIGGTSYVLQILGFGPNSSSLYSQFSSPEGGTNSTLIWGSINIVPVPGAFLLGFLGLGAAGLKLRRFA